MLRRSDCRRLSDQYSRGGLQHLHRSARFSFLLFTLGIVVLLTSCGPYRVDYMEDSLRRASQQEIIHKFGHPQRLKRTKNGDTVWEYDFQGKGSECASYILTFDPEDELRDWKRKDCAPATGSDVNSR